MTGPGKSLWSRLAVPTRSQRLEAVALRVVCAAGPHWLQRSWNFTGMCGMRFVGRYYSYKYSYMQPLRMYEPSSLWYILAIGMAKRQAVSAHFHLAQRPQMYSASLQHPAVKHQVDRSVCFCFPTKFTSLSERYAEMGCLENSWFKKDHLKLIPRR